LSLNFIRTLASLMAIVCCVHNSISSLHRRSAAGEIRRWTDELVRKNEPATSEGRDGCWRLPQRPQHTFLRALYNDYSHG